MPRHRTSIGYTESDGDRDSGIVGPDIEMEVNMVDLNDVVTNLASALGQLGFMERGNFKVHMRASRVLNMEEAVYIKYVGHKGILFQACDILNINIRSWDVHNFDDGMVRCFGTFEAS